MTILKDLLRYTAVFLVLALTFIACPNPNGGNGDVPGNTGTPDTSWYNEDDTEFSIVTANQLAGLAELVNAGNNFAGKTVKLSGSINLASYARGEGWTPIGDYNNHFTGTFDGGGYTISGLTINRPDFWCQGLFGYVGTGGSVKNLNLTGLAVVGMEPVGGLAGQNEGTVEKVSVSGSVTGRVNDYPLESNTGGLVGRNSGTVLDSRVTGNVSGLTGVGGLVGGNDGTVQNSYATGSVSGQGWVGGLVGDNGGTVQNSYATGNVTGTDTGLGGLVGLNYGTVQNSYATGSVASTAARVGGLVGSNSGGVGGGDHTPVNIYATVENSYATGSVTGQHEVGGLVGSNGAVNSTVKNSAALNPSITRSSGTSTSFGRVVGSNGGGTLTNNHGRVNMAFNNTPSGTFTPTPTITSSDTGIHGADVSAGTGAGQYNIQSFWQITLGWNFSTIWVMGANNLPMLQGVGP